MKDDLAETSVVSLIYGSGRVRAKGRERISRRPLLPLWGLYLLRDQVVEQGDKGIAWGNGGPPHPPETWGLPHSGL